MTPALSREERDAIRAEAASLIAAPDFNMSLHIGGMEQDLARFVIDRVPALLDALAEAKAEIDRLHDLLPAIREGYDASESMRATAEAERDALAAQLDALRARIDHIVDRYGGAHDARNCAVLHDLRALAADEDERTGR